MLIFISYRKQNRSQVDQLSADLETLGNTVWFDNELSGGHTWWDSILESVRSCDLFVFALTEEALASSACKLEYEYAHSLNKRILPVMLADVNNSLLPPELAVIQWVDYRQRDPSATLRLGRALMNLSPAVPLPDPLPPPPEPPLSPLGKIGDQIDDPVLAPDAQRLLLSKLQDFIDDPETRKDALLLLRRFQQREDLIVRVAQQIEALLREGEPAPLLVKTVRQPALPSTQPAQTRPAPIPDTRPSASSTPTPTSPSWMRSRGVWVLLAVVGVLIAAALLLPGLLRQGEATPTLEVLAGPPPTATDDTVAVVPTATSDTDSDSDGVADAQDACPAQGDQGAGIDSSGCPIATPAPEQPALMAAELVVWVTSAFNEGDQAFLEEMAARWAADYAPGSTLKIVAFDDTGVLRDSFLTSEAAGTDLPDLIISYAIQDMMPSGRMTPWNDQVDLSVYNQAVLENMQVGGFIYGLPLWVDSNLMLIYNAPLMNEMGFEVPETWDRVFEIAKEAASAGQIGFTDYFNNTFWFLPIAYGYGARIVDSDGDFTLDTREWVDSYGFLLDMVSTLKDESAVPMPCDYDCVSTAFSEGRVLMTVNGHWALPEFQAALGNEAVGIAPWPMLPNGERPASLVQGMFVAVPAGLPEERAATARSLAHWITTDDTFVTQITAESIHLPAVSYISFDNDPLRTAISVALENSVGLPYIPAEVCFWGTIQTTLDRLLAGEIAPKEAASLTQLGVNDCIAAQQMG